MKPGPTLLRCLLALFVLALALIALRVGELPGAGLLARGWLFALGALFGVALVDGLRARREPPLSVRRRLPRSLALGRHNRVRLRIESPLSRTVTGRVTDHYPETLRVSGIPRHITLPPGGELDLDYRVEAMQRGEVVFAATEVETASPWHLWRRRQLTQNAQPVRVFPDFMSFGNLREFSDEQGAALLGIHMQRKRGEGTEFMQLREFRDGDVLRQVDWKASARICKLISREYQDERDRDIIFLLDCGRRMHSRDGDLSHFDHALNAILLTAWFALRQGDGVGVCTFAGRELWLEPRRHRDGIHRLLDQLYDLQSSTGSTDFLEAAQRLMARRNKRALVILVTNLQEEDRQDLDIAVRVMGRHHAVIVANLQEAALIEQAASPVEDFESALKLSVATGLLRGRERVLEHLRQRGAWVVNCVPRELSRALAGQYLALKRAGVI